MAQYEELVELGFEGVDKFADKYHDKVYDRLPAVPIGRKKRQQQQQQRQQVQTRTTQQTLQTQQEYPRDEQRPPDLRPYPEQRYQGYSHNQSGRAGAEKRDRDDVTMSSYGASPRSERDHRPRSDEHYYEDERIYYSGPDAATAVPQGREAVNGMRGQQVTAYQPPAAQNRYEPSARERPSNARRGSSWSPPRRSKEERRNRTQSRPRARSRSRDKQHRLAATIGGALIGGIAGNQAGKGKKFDSAATFIGAVVGGLGAREATEFWDKKQAAKERGGEAGYDSSDDGGAKRERRRDSRYEREGRDEGYYGRDGTYEGDARYERDHANDRRY